MEVIFKGKISEDMERYLSKNFIAPCYKMCTPNNLYRGNKRVYKSDFLYV